MKKSLLLVGVAAIALSTIGAKKSDDPTLMTINGINVPVSEFKYLYNKNNTQQAQQQPIDEYLDMFINYKLKVADAEAAGLDTTATFKREFEGYKATLSAPYLKDNTALDDLIREGYAHMSEEVDVSHIMIPRGTNHETAKVQRHKLDSIRTLIIEGADFATLASQNSIDPGVRRNQGHMGWITANQYPYSFEKAAYETPVGEISQVIDTDYGHHIIKVNARRPARGEVLVEHILRLFPRGRNAENAPEVKASIDSIYQLVIAGGDFEELARQNSEDPGSARNGGKLPWFGAGRMVAEFDSVSFALNVGEISVPFETAYGYHIVKKLDAKGIGTYDEVSGEIKNAIERDERHDIPVRNFIDQHKALYKAKINPKGIEAIMKEVNAHGQLDSAVIATMATNKTPLMNVGKTVYTVGDKINKVLVTTPIKVSGAELVLNTAFTRALDEAILDQAREDLANTNAEYSSLLNEYHDGMLLFEISNSKVWEKASKDKEGLEKFFQANKSKYVWPAPKYKGFIVFTPNDSVEALVKEFVATHTLANDSVQSTLSREFGRDVKAERVIAAKGDNAIVDNVAFGGEKPAPAGRWVNWFGLNGKIIEQPEEAADVRGAVTTDYQAKLEQEWIEELRAKYPYSVNMKVFETLK